jgi:hypothetical protein
MKNIFVGGLWFNAKGPMAKEICRNGFAIAPTTGLHTMEERIYELEATIAANSDARTLTGHSGGAVVIAHAGMAGLIPRRITQIALMCSGPLPGIGYGLRDNTTQAMLRSVYLKALWKGEDYELEDEEVRNLLSVPEHDLEAMRKNLVPDSGKFTRETFLGRFARKPLEGFLWAPGRRIAEVLATHDVIIGSTGPKTSELYDANVKMPVTGGHMQPMIDFARTLEGLHSQGFVF